MQHQVLLAMLLAGLSCAPASLSAANQTDAGLEKFFERYLDQYFEMRPSEATQLGNHRFDHLLEDLSPAGREKWQQLAKSTLEALPREVDYVGLSRPAQIDFEIFKQDLVRTVWMHENTHPFEEDPRVYNDYINDSVYLLLAQSTLPLETNVAHCIARMGAIPRIVAAARKNLSNPPRVHTETAIRQNRGAIGFYERDIFELAGKTRQIKVLRAAAVPVVNCLREYQQFLEKDLLPRADGQWRIGREKFARKLELTLDAGLTADQVLADAEAEFRRVETEMYVVGRQLWSRHCPGLALPADDAAGRRATIAAVLKAIAKDHGKPEKLTAEIKDCVKQIKRFIASSKVLELPRPDRCQVIEMPEFKRGNSTAYMNSPPPLDTNAAGYYAVSPPPKDWDTDKVRSYLEEYNAHMLPILTIHEAYPGHYVQLEYANANRSLIRKVLGSGVYIEGWAVYTEQMMLDQGYGEGDLALRLTQLKFYLRAVANAILDHKMHCGDMSEEEALAFLTEGAYQSEGEARLKIIRSQQSSAQLSTYFVGRMAHYRLRQQIQRELNSGFDLARYHHAVLEPGAVPVKYLPELVRARLNTPK